MTRKIRQTLADIVSRQETRDVSTMDSIVVQLVEKMVGRLLQWAQRHLNELKTDRCNVTFERIGGDLHEVTSMGNSCLS
jgi:hypothetical protein